MSVKTSIFMRDLLEQCIGTVMIEADQWGFPNDIHIFDRGYFNARLKKESSINSKTQERLVLIFSYLFDSAKLTGRFHEPEAVKAANALISLFMQYFNVDLSIWKNSHTADNSTSRAHILSCLESVLSLCIDCENLPCDKISEFLQQYLVQEQESNEKSLDIYPVFLTDMPYQQTEYYTGRTSLTSRVQQL